ncbi:serine/threonine-protein kinase [Nonomuraea angiospora]|uniref:non-specific serine/threonine protein kinase n=1 Tax=Nonomuraea angiospora TaxID=46172 RepID=A0ABR9MFK6_9ACTN|nr:serine/threonine-protein kinase [Nonomuraea angiospora]MBE1591131.1 serine/threonine-protein kinase [Nonomuraea angiospora]
MVPGYREVRQLGAGRTGRVFLATYQQTGAYVAIKYLNATLRRDAEFMDRFRSDTHELVEIDDPNVVRLYEYVETPTRAAVVMELVDGVSLRTLLAEHRGISPEAALTVLKSTLLALAAAHERGVPHRDVKPENILVQADGTSKLADFGVVVHAEEPGVPAGSPEYMSPELWTQGRAGPPADVYAAACVLFEAVRGRPPYRAVKEGGDGALDVPALRDKHLVEPVPLEVAPDSLRDLLRRGMAKDPATRYASARQFAAELEEDAVAGYGPDWEKRGRRHLGELATLLALRFPLARTERAAGVTSTIRDRIPRLPPHLWVAGATVAAVAISLMMSGGRLPPGPGAILMPPPKTAQGEPEPVDAATPTRTRTSAAPRRSTPARTVSPPPSSPPATVRQGGTSVPRPTAVRAAGIVGWSGTAGTIRVAADGTGPVRLRISYTRREGDGGAARTVRQETRTLQGSTAYSSAVTHDPGSVSCGKRVYVGIVVMTEPAAGNGPQVSEAAVDGPACPTPTPTPTSHSPTPTPTPTPSEEHSRTAVGTPAPSEESFARSPDEPTGQASEEPMMLLSTPEEEPPL